MVDKNLETNTLICLDTAINTDIQQRFRSVINQVKLFDEIHACKQYIQITSSNDRIILIANGQLGKEIVPQIHSCQQISMIYIYCSDVKKHQQWTQTFSKIKYVTNQLDELVSRIHNDKTEIDEPIVINIFNSNSTQADQSTSGMNGNFLHSQLLIDTLLRMKSNSTDKNELITICRQEYENNPNELTILDEFQKDYTADRALWWYTRESFLYRLMNKALRIQNIDLLYLFRFFMRDIAEQLRCHRCSSPMQLYRGQIIAKTELNALKNSIGQLISVNSFLSTSTNRKLALSFLQSSSVSSDDFEKILFEIQADPETNESKPFANITSFSYFPGEDEVLMMLGSIFRLENIDFDQKIHCSIIRLTLCGDKDHDLQDIYAYSHERLEKFTTSLYSFGQVLHGMGKLDAAERYIHRFLDELPRNQQQDFALAYHALGVICEEKGDYDTSLQWHQKSIDLYRKFLKSNDLRLVDVYNCLAVVYRKKNEFQKAFETYEQAMKILRQAPGNNDFKVAICINNMGVVYYEDKKYAKALEYYQKALNIWQRYLPTNHSHFGAVYNNIGEVYRYLKQYDRALEVHEKSLKIYEKSQSSEHQDVATTLENMGLVYEEKRDLQKSISYLEKAANIFRKKFQSTHPDVIRVDKNLERVRSKIK